jgi:hypothetical protein
MTKYAAFDATTKRVVGWYDTDLHPNMTVPAGAIQLTDAQWAGRMANPSGWSVENGALVAFTPTTAPTPDPAPVMTIPSATYLARFDAGSLYRAIDKFGLTGDTDDQLDVFHYTQIVTASPTIALDSPVVIAGHAKLVALGLLTQQQSDAILAPRTDGT